MLRIAVVDDEADQRALIAEYLARFAREQHREIDVDAYCNGFDFLSVFDSRYDAVFLDIQMPDMNGIQVAEEIRATDQRVKIVFITNLGQYAVQGYAVRAMDFIVKPLDWESFNAKMQQFCRDYDAEQPRFITIRNAEGTLRLRTRPHLVRRAGESQTARAHVRRHLHGVRIAARFRGGAGRRRTLLPLPCFGAGESAVRGAGGRTRLSGGRREGAGEQTAPRAVHGGLGQPS